MIHRKKCLECGEVMENVAWSRRYCSPKCRQKAYYWRAKRKQEKQKDKTRRG